MSRYVIACSTPWFLSLEKSAAFTAFDFTYVQRKEDLTLERLAEVDPRYIFFPHWSWIVPKAILELYECICFHSTPVPYGRGGSPIQNMIVRGHKETTVTALRMTEELDAGPVYLQEEVSLQGSGDDIYTRVAKIVERLVVRIINESPVPQPQQGEVTTFKRRSPAESVLPFTGTMEQIYDHIRMLDAKGYPHAFIEYGDFIIELTRAALIGNGLDAHVSIRRKADIHKK